MQLTPSQKELLRNWPGGESATLWPSDYHMLSGGSTVYRTTNDNANIIERLHSKGLCLPCGLGEEIRTTTTGTRILYPMYLTEDGKLAYRKAMGLCEVCGQGEKFPGSKMCDACNDCAGEMQA